MSKTGISPARVRGALAAAEAQRYRDTHPASARLAGRARAHLPGGVPMHGMGDRGLDFPLFLASASGARVRDADGCEYADFCRGDTGAMFGLARLSAARGLPWCTVRFGARLEPVLRAAPPANAAGALAAADPALEALLHPYRLNRGVLATPFHDRLLVSPHTEPADVDRLVAILDSALAALTGDAA